MDTVIHIFTFNKTLNKSTAMMLVYAQIALLCVVWFLSPSVFLPTPSETFHSLTDLWGKGIGSDLFISFNLNIQAIAYSTIVSLILAYLTTLPFFRPIVGFVSKLRFLSMVGLTFFFTLMSSSAHTLKLSLLVFSVSVFFVTSMADVLNSIPKVQFDLARTLRMKEWEVVWEVIILGQADKVFDVMRQNAAMSWLMISFVEGISRSEGGVGTVLLNVNKQFNLSSVMAIQLMVLLMGLGQDYAIGLMKSLFCPYSNLLTERK
jgi:NitT/TauT family transport system permease protein